MFQTIGGILIAILVLLAMITIHELGHFLAGRLLKFKINEFAVGMGPKLISKKRKDGVVFSLRAFPLGGFCAFEGEDSAGSGFAGGEKKEETEPYPAEDLKNADELKAADSDKENGKPEYLAFEQQKPWKRIIVLAMGGIFNLISGLIFAFIALLAVGNTFKTGAEPLMIASVFESKNGYVFSVPDVDNPTNEDGIILAENPNLGKIKAGDIVLNVNGTEIKAYNELSEAFKKIPLDMPFYVIVSRETAAGNARENITVGELIKCKYEYTVPSQSIYNCSGSSGASKTGDGIGIGLSNYYMGKDGKATSYKKDYNVWTALCDTPAYTFKMAGMILSSLGSIFTKGGMENVGGTVTTIAVIGKVATAGIENFLFILPLIAVNLGVFNLLPVPALDGSRIVFRIIEWIRKKPVNKNFEGWFHAIGLIVLFGFIILADILQIFVFT